MKELEVKLISAIIEALRTYDISNLLNAEREKTKEEIRQWLIDEDYEGLAERI